MPGSKDFDAPKEISRVEAANDGVNFDAKVIVAIDRSTGVQDAVKKLIWCTVKEKIIVFIIAGTVLLATNFIGGMVQELGKKIITR